MKTIKLYLFGVIVWALGQGLGQSSVVTEKFLDEVEMIESSGGKFLVGDRGKSLGAFQMSRAAWKDATDFRQRQGMAIYRYEDGAMKAEICRSYASSYLQLLEDRLERLMGEEPTAKHVYAAYNWGLSNLKKVRFDLNKAPKVTRRALKRISLKST